MIDGDRVVHEARYAQPVAEVWRALTEPSAMAAWLMANDFVAVVGHRFRLDARPSFGFIDAEVVEVDAPHLLRCRWLIDGAPTMVTFRLEADGTGTVLRLEHAGLGAGPRDGFDGGWGDKLRVDLPAVLSGERDITLTRVVDGLHTHQAFEGETP